MLLTLLLPAIESIVNRALCSDPEALAKIATMKNQVIEINCTDWKMRFFILVDSQGLQFYKNYSAKANTVIHGTLNHFLPIFMKGADTKTLFNYPIDISGNTHNIEVLRDAFKNLDIDFEEKLSHFLGDGVAHKLCFKLKEAKKTLENTAKKMELQTKEYIHYEAKNGVSQKQAERFYAEVATLRDDVDRMAARLGDV